MKIDILTKALRRASTALLRDFHEIKHFKHDAARINNFITFSRERLINDIIFECQRYFPEYKLVLSNEPNQLEGQDSYIMFDAINGIDNMRNLSPFFGSTILLSTLKNNQRINTGLMYFPCLDQICYGTAKDAWTEDTSSRRYRVELSSVNNLYSTDYITHALLEMLNEQQVHLESLRVVGSGAYALMLFLTRSAGKCILPKNDYLQNLLAELFTASAGGVVQKGSMVNIYSHSA